MKGLNPEEIQFIKDSFKWALMRMEELPIQNWGSYSAKKKSMDETKEKQNKILRKLIAGN